MQKLIFSFLVLSLFSLTACMQTLVENAAESAIENSMDGELAQDVDLDLSDGTVEINTEEGVFQGGANAEWPSNVPEDLYQMEGIVLSSMSDLTEDTYWVMLQVDMTVEEANTLYTQELEAEGWTLTGTANFAGTTSITAEKGERQVVIMVTASEGQTSVTVAGSKL